MQRRFRGGKFAFVDRHTPPSHDKKNPRRKDTFRAIGSFRDDNRSNTRIMVNQTGNSGELQYKNHLAYGHSTGDNVSKPAAYPSFVSEGIPNKESIWAEVQCSGGKSYFYNLKTKNTTWIRPHGPAVRIIRHEDVKNIDPSGQLQRLQSPPGQAHSTGSPAHSTNTISPGLPNIQIPPPGFISQQRKLENSPTPFSHVIMPSVSVHNGPPQHEQMVSLSSVMMPSPIMSSSPAYLNHPPPGYSPQIHAPLQFVSQPPSPLIFENVAPFPLSQPWGQLGLSPSIGVHPLVPSIPNGYVAPASLIPYADQTVTAKTELNEWTEHISPEGRSYFYNIKTNESVWELPQAATTETNPGDQSVTTKQDAIVQKEKELVPQEEEPVIEKIAEKKPEVPIKIKREPEKSRPVSSTPVPGTPWCVVWTNDKKVFFFNASTKRSVWERPKELVGRLEVDKMVRTCPCACSTIDTKNKHNEENEVKSESAVAVEKEDGTPPAKRVKIDAIEIIELEKSSSTTTDTKDLPDKMKGENQKPKAQDDPIQSSISLQLMSAAEAEAQAAKERATLPFELRLKAFRDMLVEKEISAFSTWEKELHKIVFDSRYLLLPSKERKQAFDNYVKERAEKEGKEKKAMSKKIKKDFMSFLDEVQSKHNPKLKYIDFASKYGRDSRFKIVEKQRDREAYFHEHAAKSKKKLKHEKKRLQKIEIKLNKSTKISADKTDESVGPVVPTDCQVNEEDTDCTVVEDLSINNEVSKEKDKQEREANSIREREKEVEKTLAIQLKERQKEGDEHRHSKAVEEFRIFLSDHLKSGGEGKSWKEIKKKAKGDERWSLFSILSKEEMKDLYFRHCEKIREKKKQRFRDLLDENDVKMDSTWKRVKERIRDDPRFVNFSQTERQCELEFKAYLKEKSFRLEKDFWELLKETKTLTYKTKQEVSKNPQMMKDIELLLANDKRYLLLDNVPKKRDRLIAEFLHHLEKKGAPPPPTAYDPNENWKK